MAFSYPLMIAIQEISARIGRTTGRGIAANLARHYPNGLLVEDIRAVQERQPLSRLTVLLVLRGVLYPPAAESERIKRATQLAGTD